MNLSKILWDKLIKTATYLKNWSPGVNGITIYELGNHVCPDFSYLKVVGPLAWVNISKKKMVELDIHSWQEIIIDYEDTNSYQVYYPRNGKIHITWDLFVDKQHLYHRKALNNWEYLKDN